MQINANILINDFKLVKSKKKKGARRPYLHAGGT